MIQIAIFDMDGTVFESHLDWLKIRTELKIPAGGNILAEIYRNQEVDRKRLGILEQYERENTLNTRPIKGIREFLQYLQTIRVVPVLVTNNNRENTGYLLTKFHLTFDLVITREMGLWKPGPKAFLYVMKNYHCNPEEIISIGDSHYDIEASQQAGVSRIYIINTPRTLQMKTPDILLFQDYVDLKQILQRENQPLQCRHVD